MLIGCFPPTIDVIIDPVQIVSPFRSFLIAFRLIKNPSHCFVVGKVSVITITAVAEQPSESTAITV